MARSGSAGAGTLDLAHLQAKLGALDKERQKVVDRIQQFINHATRLIQRSGGSAEKGRTGSSRRVAGKPRRSRLSAAARKRISAAQKKRWAAQRASQKAGRS